MADADGGARQARPSYFWQCNIDRGASRHGRGSGRIALGLGAALAIAAFVGCSADAIECHVGADCASGMCRSDGTCVPVTPGAGGMGGAGAQAGHGGAATGGGAEGGSGATGGAGAAGGGTTCLPNHDGTIERGEIPLRAGLSAKFMTALDVTVDTAGETQPDQSRLWDWSASLQGDALTIVETREIDGEWFADSFPGASYAALLSSTEDLLGVFEITDDQLLLRGVVSPADDLYRTELSYDPPVVVVDFPLTMDKSWQSSATVTGVAMGIMAYYTEDYDYEVDAHGSMVVPYGTFDVLRTRVTLTRTVGLLQTVVRSFAFTAECFSTVASVSSNDNESAEQFESAAEVRRLAP